LRPIIGPLRQYDFYTSGTRFLMWFIHQKLHPMKTHKVIKSLFIAAMMALASPACAVTADPVALTEETPGEKIERLQKRIEEIHAMDRSKMSRAERKALKKEVRQIRDEVKALSGGVYISVGALLIIILLIILL